MEDLTSKGARLERRAVREYARRRLARAQSTDNHAVAQECVAWVQWLLKRVIRYEGKAGGLKGRKAR